MAEAIADPLIARDLIQVVDPRTSLTIVLPAGPAGIAESLSFPPRLGEHNEAIYGNALGYSNADLIRLQEQGTI
jgi:crotonobetainyl-CoA:carnitine CoA-transferase CaiB-like acyl-CoA transferase